MSVSPGAPTRVALDVMGGDKGPAEVILGAVQAARAYHIGVYLVGNEEIIKAELAKHDTAGLDLPILHTAEVIEMDEHPSAAVRRKKNASMVLALQLVRDRKALGAVSAGNSGAMLAASLFTLKRLPGVDRPALGGVFPTRYGASLIIDMGANTDCKPEYLQQFALMGSTYMERIFNIPNPRVGLLANGTEEGKGNQQVIETHKLLKESARTLGLNFIGNIEGNDIPTGHVEVVVCDGFVGNTVLKTSEGVGETMLDLIKTEMTKSLLTKLAAAILKPGLRKVFKKLDYAEYGGVPLLGVNGAAIVAHGRSNARAIQNAIRVAKQTGETGVAQAIAAGLTKLYTTEEVL
jgi:fatty acid/phospholipid synthesis protein PlsX